MNLFCHHCLDLILLYIFQEEQTFVFSFTQYFAYPVYNNWLLVFCDYRPSSERLRNAAVAGVEAAGGKVWDLGVITTPVIHYIVTCHNDGGK